VKANALKFLTSMLTVANFPQNIFCGFDKNLAGKMG
jgi:hypothetical protein